MQSRRFFAKSMFATLGAGAVAMSGAVTAASAQTSSNSLERILGAKKLRMGAVGATPPNAYMEITTGKWTGINIELGQQLAKDMGVELEIIETTWGNSVLDLQTDKIDVMFGFGITPQRMLAVDFSDMVSANGLAVTVAPGIEVSTWEDLNKPTIRIAADIGSYYEQHITRLCPKAEIVRFKTVEEGALALRSRRVDAHCVQWLASAKAVKADPAIGRTVVPTPGFFSGGNIGIRRESDKAFRDYLNVWLRYSKDKGFIQEVNFKYLELAGISRTEAARGMRFYGNSG